MRCIASWSNLSKRSVRGGNYILNNGVSEPEGEEIVFPGMDEQEEVCVSEV
jgi:hypothetical protein